MKQIIRYEEHNGKVEKYVDGDVIDGEVVEEGGNFWSDVWNFFFSHGATVGGNEWEGQYKSAEGEFQAEADKFGGFGDGSSSDVDGTDIRGWWG